MDWTGGPFYVEGVLETGGIATDALWTRVDSAVEESFALLINSIEVLAHLITAAAVLEPPQRVISTRTGALSFTDPRFEPPAEQARP